MSTGRTTRERLILAGMSHMLANGYDGMGVGPVLDATDVPKGSFYHYFKSKDDFAVAIIQAYENSYRALRDTIFADTTRKPLARLDQYLEFLETELAEKHPSGGCLYGAIAQTISARSPLVRQILSQSFAAWEESLCKILRDAQAAGEVDIKSDVSELAADLVDRYEGVLIRVKATDDVSAFRRFREKALQSLRFTGRSSALT